MDEHEEFRDAVSRGKTARVFALERLLLASENTALVPNETIESLISLLAKQISGNAIRPRLPETKIVEHEPFASREVRPQQCVTIDDSVDKPRIHTVSRESSGDEG